MRLANQAAILPVPDSFVRREPRAREVRFDGAKRPVRMAHRLWSHDQIMALVRHECGRCERTSGQFCLVMFEPRPGRLAARRLKQVLLKNARATDEVGQFDLTRFCVVLVDTDPAGAARYIDRVKQWTDGHDLISDSKLLVYPSPRFEQLVGDGHSFWNCDADQPQEDRYPPDAFADTSVPLARIDSRMATSNPWWKRLVDVVVSAREQI